MLMKKERNTFMIKLWDTLKNKARTMKELAQEFPEKTYRELEKYRDADRNEEAQRIYIQQENEELKENQLTESQRRQSELEPIDGEEQDNPELFEMRSLINSKWKEKYNREHKLRQEAETETILVKGIGMNSPEMKAANEKIKDLQSNLDRIKKENNNLYNRIAKLTEKDLQKARESGL